MFQTRGPATVKARSPTVECLVGGTSIHLVPPEHNVRRPGRAATGVVPCIFVNIFEVQWLMWSTIIVIWIALLMLSLCHFCVLVCEMFWLHCILKVISVKIMCVLMYVIEVIARKVCFLPYLLLRIGRVLQSQLDFSVQMFCSRFFDDVFDEGHVRKAWDDDSERLQNILNVTLVLWSSRSA